MNQGIAAIRGALEKRMTEELTRHALTNRGSFSPFRLPAATQALAAGLVAFFEDGQPGAAHALGDSLGKQGFGLPALLQAQATAQETIAGGLDLEALPAALMRTSRFFSFAIEGMVAAEFAEVERQRTEMERAFMFAANQQHEQERKLRSAISELSTPIVPVHQGILVLPLVGSLDSHRATEITERLLDSIATNHAEIVIVDITGIPIIDTSTANHLLMTARAANLLGSRIVLVGIGPEIAQTLVQLGVELQGLVTLANLQAGIAYALEQRGLGIQRLKSNGFGMGRNYSSSQ
jgi:rsbT co-antagonist protein RsbR